MSRALSIPAPDPFRPLLCPSTVIRTHTFQTDLHARATTVRRFTSTQTPAYARRNGRVTSRPALPPARPRRPPSHQQLPQSATLAAPVPPRPPTTPRHRSPSPTAPIPLSSPNGCPPCPIPQAPRRQCEYGRASAFRDLGAVPAISKRQPSNFRNLQLRTSVTPSVDPMGVPSPKLTPTAASGGRT
jgi:hypothetical protein